MKGATVILKCMKIEEIKELTKNVSTRTSSKKTWRNSTIKLDREGKTQEKLEPHTL